MVEGVRGTARKLIRTIELAESGWTERDKRGKR
jgi:hypothetical protein